MRVRNSTPCCLVRLALINFLLGFESYVGGVFSDHPPPVASARYIPLKSLVEWDLGNSLASET